MTDSGPGTLAHIRRVQQFLGTVLHTLYERSRLHDRSKMEPPEKDIFDLEAGKLSTMTYGSAEYKLQLERLAPALRHHYALNPHHPEFHPEGVNDMTLVDLIEMLCDWKAASERHENGNIMRSIAISSERFGISPQLRRILENTAIALDEHDPGPDPDLDTPRSLLVQTGEPETDC